MYLIFGQSPRMARSRFLNPEYIPTALIQDADRPSVPILDLAQHRRVSGLGVVFRFFWFGLGLFRRRLFRIKDEQKTAIETRRLFERLGGVWIKVGQLLSLRADLFSDTLCNELSRLQFVSVGFPSAVARQTIEQELGQPLAAIFARFDDEPIAAASIAQVHRAVLWESQRLVVVKVQHPYAAHSFRRDILLLRRLVKILSWLLPLRHLRLGDALAELNDIVEEEIDYTFEASNLHRLQKILRRQDVYVPHLYTEYCACKVLVMEEVQGVLMSDVISVKNKNPELFEQWCAENAIKPKRIAQRLFLSSLQQLLENNLFHGDMHPGNILLLRKNRYALIDFGTIGTLERSFLDSYLASLNALVKREYTKAANLSLFMCPEIPSIDLNEVRTELARAFKHWHAKSEAQGLTYHERSLTASSKMVGQVLGRYRLQTSWTYLRMGRSWGTLDTSLAYLYPEMSHARMFKRYFKAASRRRRRDMLKRLRRSVGEALQTVQEYNFMLGPMLQDTALSYKQRMAKLAAIGATIMRFVRLGIIGLTGFFGYLFLYQHHFNLIELIHSEPLDSLVDDIPTVEYEWFLMLLVGLVVFVKLSRRIIRILETPDRR